jgi:hypothetical protein
VTQVGAPVQGEVLASRYRLDELVLTDASVGHALWRGTDSLLNRPVAIELRVPGGAAAEEMLRAAVTAGRIVHPCVVGVYDAVDEGDRAFVVREWVEGRSLRDTVREGPIAPGRAAAIARTTADALASIHASGHTHGNLHPGTILLGADDEITLTDLRLDPDSTPQADVRAIGGLLYTALTTAWPHELPPADTGLADAVRVDGRLLSPRQVRAGIPGYLDALTMDLLDPAVPAPPAAELAAELRRYDVADPDLGPLSALTPEPAPPPPTRWKRIGVPVAGVICLILVGLVIVAINTPGKNGSYPPSNDPTRSRAPSAPASSNAVLKPSDVLILDPPGGDLTELKNKEKAADGNSATEWRTQDYNTPEFGKIPDKPGMGVVLDLGSPKQVKQVTVQLSAVGTTIDVRASDTAPQRDVNVFTKVADAQTNTSPTVKFTLAKPVTNRYIMIWITSMPFHTTGYGIGVKEITVGG